MSQRALGDDVGFTAEDLVIVDGKFVGEAMRLFTRGLDASLEQSSSLQLSPSANDEDDELEPGGVA